MPRTTKCLPVLVVFSMATPLALAGPSDLLNQAVKENQAAAPGGGLDADELVKKADRLANQAAFDEAIQLYERAYRLSPQNQSNYVRLLVAKRAAGRMTAQDREALTLIEEQRAAEVDQIFRAVRLNMIQARQALRRDDLDLARLKLRTAGADLDRLPAFVDATPYRQELKRLDRTLRGRLQNARPAARPDRATAVDGRTLLQTRPVVRQARESPPTLVDTGEAQEAAPGENVETGEIIEVDEVLGGSHGRHVYDRELAAALSRSRARTILGNNEAAFSPESEIGFPEDWPERTRRRAKYRDGVIHTGRSFTGEDGKTYQTVIYDIGELVHPVPHFYADYPGSVRRQRFETLDREALRFRSEIFGGFADDLAAGLPLLHFFGGIDNNVVSTRADPAEVERITAILERFIHDR